MLFLHVKTFYINIIAFFIDRLELYRLLVYKYQADVRVGLPLVYVDVRVGLPLVYVDVRVGVPLVYVDVRVGVPLVYVDVRVGVPWISCLMSSCFSLIYSIPYIKYVRHG